MTGIVRILLAGGVALGVALFLLRPAGKSASQQVTAKNQVEQAYAEADRKNRFLNGYDRLRDTAMAIETYYRDNEELPTDINEVRFGLPEPGPGGPSEYLFDSHDANLTMYFQGIEGIPDGGVNYTPKISDNKKRLNWECWTSHYPQIKQMLPTCKYFAP